MRISDLATINGQFYQAILLFFIGSILLAACFWTINVFYLQSAFFDLQEWYDLKNNDRAFTSIENEQETIANLTDDWANWDDTYIFAGDRNQAYIKSNYPSAETLSKISGIDMLILINEKGAMLLQGAYHPERGNYVDISTLTGDSSPIKKVLNLALENEGKIDGLVNTEYGLLILAVRPILTTNGEGPSRGELVLGRFFTKAVLQKIRKRTCSEVRIIMRSSDERFQDEIFNRFVIRSSPSRPVLVGSDISRIIADVFHQPVALLVTPMSDKLVHFGERTGRNLFLVLVSFSLPLLVALVIYRSKMRKSVSALTQSEARYRQLFESESDAILLIELKEGNILDANQAASDLYGYDHNSLQQLKIFDLLFEPNNNVESIYNQINTAGQVIKIPLQRHRNRGGHEFFVEITGRSFPFQNNMVQILAIRDITERKRIEGQLQFTQLVVENMNDSTFWVDEMGSIVYANDVGCRSLGYEKGELEGMSLTLIDLDFCKQNWPSRWRELKRKKHILLETAHRTKDLRIIPVEMSCNYVEFDGIPYNCAIIRDITERRNLEKERQHLYKVQWQLKKDESLRQMAGAIAHNFNNQLMIVIGYIELAITAQPDPNVTISQYLGKALSATKRTAKASGLMLTYLGMRSGKLEKIDLSLVCRDSIPLIPSLASKQISLEFSLPDCGPYIFADLENIQTMLTNLVTNGVEACSGGDGRIKVGVKTVEAVDFIGTHFYPVNWLMERERYACLTISDNGDGIPSENIDKLFDPFFSTKFIGRGMGLSIVIGIVKGLGGGILVNSEPGHGTVFQIYLPMYGEDEVVSLQSEMENSSAQVNEQ